MRALAASVMLVVSAAHAQSAEAPPKLGILVLLKVLTYDAGFDARGQGDFVVVVPFSKGNEDRAQRLVDELGSIEVKTIKQRRLVFRSVLAGERLDGQAVLFTSALTHDRHKPVLEAATSAKLYSLAFAEEEVQEGALLGVVQAGGKLQPVINVATAKLLGAEFAASVLKVARTVSAR